MYGSVLLRGAITLLAWYGLVALTALLLWALLPDRLADGSRGGLFFGEKATPRDLFEFYGVIVAWPALWLSFVISPVTLLIMSALVRSGVVAGSVAAIVGFGSSIAIMIAAWTWWI